MLKVENLKVELKIEGEFVPVVDHISFEIPSGGTFGLVGESGCGKSITSKSLMGLLDPAISRVRADKMEFNGQDLLALGEPEWRKIRGNQISMIFQNPMTHLNPLMRCGRQIEEGILLHRRVSKKAARSLALELLEKMEFPNPNRAHRSYPYELSGGMKQRIMIAMALACRPQLLIADEPTTALDVTVQAQILELIGKLQKDFGMGLLLVTHDLGVVEDRIDQLAVMYAGQMVEKGPAREVLKHPEHPYTRGLINSIPKVSFHKPRLEIISGRVPSPADFPQGCRFAPRCKFRQDPCSNLTDFALAPAGHQNQCLRKEELAGVAGTPAF